jgi:hypothetical protein
MHFGNPRGRQSIALSNNDLHQKTRLKAGGFARIIIRIAAGTGLSTGFAMKEAVL